MIKSKNTAIIIAEDDPDDRLMLMEAFTEIGVNNEIVMAADGEELMGMLEDYHRRPCLILMDLNLPRKDGRQVLLEIRSNEQFKHIPVIIFTTSSAPGDIQTSYKRGCNTYFTKPSTYAELVKILDLIKSYWLENAIF